MPKIDPTGPVPPYLQVAEIIRNQIRSGKLPTGSRITEAEITETYEVARSTARRTLAVLRDERAHLAEALDQFGKFSALTADTVNQTKENLVKELKELAPRRTNGTAVGSDYRRGGGVVRCGRAKG